MSEGNRQNRGGGQGGNRGGNRGGGQGGPRGGGNEGGYRGGGQGGPRGGGRGGGQGGPRGGGQGGPRGGGQGGPRGGGQGGPRGGGQGVPRGGGNEGGYRGGGPRGGGQGGPRGGGRGGPRGGGGGFEDHRGGARGGGWASAATTVTEPGYTTPPPAEVKEIEELSEQVAKIRIKDIPMREDAFLKSRKGPGTVGQTKKVLTNCWDFSMNNKELICYDIQINALYRDGEEKPISKNTKDLQSKVSFLAREMDDSVFSNGGRFFYSLKPLEKNKKFELNEEKKYALPDDEGPKLSFSYTVRRTGKISAKGLFDYLNATQTESRPQSEMNMVDTLIKFINKNEYDLFNGVLYKRKPVLEERQKLFDVFRGFSLTVRPQWKVRLVADLAHKAFFPTGLLSDTLYEAYGDSLYNPRQWEEIGKFIKSLKCSASHYKNDKGVPYTRRLTAYGLSDKSATDIKFMVASENREMSIVDYFQKQYGIKLEYPELPCVKTSASRDEYIPMELLTAMPHQPARTPNTEVAATIIRAAAIKPERRFGEISNFIKSAVKSSALTNALALSLEANPVTVNARTLPAPKIPGLEYRWSPKPFAKVASPEVNYVVIDFTGRANVDSIVPSIESAASFYGLTMKFVKSLKRRTVQEYVEKLRELKTEKVDLAICIVDVFKYGDFKRFCEFEQYMLTQVVRLKTATNRKAWENIMLKINGKLGGVNWRIGGVNKHWGDKLVMVVGADVTHPGPTSGNTLKKSIAAVVASVTPDYMRCVAVVKQQDYELIKDTRNAKEEIDDMEAIFIQLLKAFHKKNNRLPDMVLYYRDGVSEGQFRRVTTYELQKMQRACKRLDLNYEPGFTIIVVQKRHKVRLFNTQDLSNVTPGTVVDTEITHKRENDFYLCSHQGIQGTSKPAHYHVIYDDNDLGPNELQLFTYYLCHCYMRCQRSVSYPAPTYYAHLAAFRAREWVKGLDQAAIQKLLEDNQFKVLPQIEEAMYFL